MRRMRLVMALCLLLLFVPIYLWKVQGWWATSDGNAVPAPRVEPKGEIKDDLVNLARTDPVEMLNQSLLHYKTAGVKEYTCTLVMQERINGKLKAPETIESWFKEEPFSVFMHWKEGAGKADASLYVAGEHDGKMCVRPSGAAKVLGWVKRAPDASDAKESSRYLITEFGLRCGTERTYKAWKALRDRGVTLQVEYLGLRKNVPEVGGRDCHVVKRTCNPPEEDGMTEVTILIDAETWFQVGSILKKNDELIGYYYFKDIKLDPTFDEGRFKPEMLKKY